MSRTCCDYQLIKERSHDDLNKSSVSAWSHCCPYEKLFWLMLMDLLFESRLASNMIRDYSLMKDSMDSLKRKEEPHFSALGNQQSLQARYIIGCSC